MHAVESLATVNFQWRLAAVALRRVPRDRMPWRPHRCHGPTSCAGRLDECCFNHPRLARCCIMTELQAGSAPVVTRLSPATAQSSQPKPGGRHVKRSESLGQSGMPQSTRSWAHEGQYPLRKSLKSLTMQSISRAIDRPSKSSFGAGILEAEHHGSVAAVLR